MNTSTPQPPAPQLALIALSPCICGAAVDQDECPYPTGLLPTGDERAIFKVTCTDPNCGWSAIGYGADGARTAWNTRPQSRPEAELPEVVITDAMVERAFNAIHWMRIATYPQEELRAALQAAYGQQCAATRPSRSGVDGAYLLESLSKIAAALGCEPELDAMLHQIDFLNGDTEPHASGIPASGATCANTPQRSYQRQDEPAIPASIRNLVLAVQAEFCSPATERNESDDSKVSYPEEKCGITFGMIRLALSDMDVQRMTVTRPAEVGGDGWLPIESAPRDGTNVLLLVKWSDIPMIGHFSHNKWWAETEHYETACSSYCYGGSPSTASGTEPTHWQPLPPAPGSEVRL